MLNKIWGGMIVLSFVTAVVTGRLENLTAGALDGAAQAVETCIGLLGAMCLWSGIARIAEDSGLVRGFARVLRPITKLIFPNLDEKSLAMRGIVMNMVANILGMGNAATPLGIAAMKELHKVNGKRDVASDEMCMFVVINTASIQLIPSTVIAMRQMYDAQNPSEVVVPVWICSVCALIFGVIATKLFQKRNKLI